MFKIYFVDYSIVKKWSTLSCTYLYAESAIKVWERLQWRSSSPVLRVILYRYQFLNYIYIILFTYLYSETRTLGVNLKIENKNRIINNNIIIHYNTRGHLLHRQPLFVLYILF